MSAGDKKWAGARVTLQRFMTRDLGLKGTELLVFAAIHGFAQATGECTTTMDYFSFWSGRSRRALTETVASLSGKGLVERRWRVSDAGRRASYRLTPLAMRPAQGPVDAGAGSANSSITLYGFYVTELGLTGADLVTYAALAELCSDGAERPVPLSWLASWSGGSRDTARRALARLEGAGLVTRRGPERAGGPNVYGLGEAALTVGDAAEIAFGRRAEAPEKAPADASDPRRADFQELRLSVNNTRGFDYGWDRYRALRDAGRTHAEIRRAVEIAAAAQREAHPEREERFFPHCERTIKQAERVLAGKQPRCGRRPGRKRGAGAAARPERPVTFHLTREERPWVVAELPDGSHALVCAWRAGMGRAEMESRLRETAEWRRWEKGDS